MPARVPLMELMTPASWLSSQPRSQATETAAPTPAAMAQPHTGDRGPENSLMAMVTRWLRASARISFSSSRSFSRQTI